jgi:molybdopterin/thiamine biosynthesis adenylyltransferase
MTCQSCFCFVAENVFDKKKQLRYDVDCVLGAVDNLEARKYVDGRCRFLGVPLIDCGTQGAQVVLCFVLACLCFLHLCLF